MKQPELPRLDSTALRLLFDFVEAADGKNKNIFHVQTEAFRFLRGKLPADQVKDLSIPSLKAEASRVVRLARKDAKHNVNRFWKHGLSMLNLGHSSLIGVYTESELAERGYELSEAAVNGEGCKRITLQVPRQSLESAARQSSGGDDRPGPSIGSSNSPQREGSGVQGGTQFGTVSPHKRPRHTGISDTESTLSEFEEQPDEEEPPQEVRKLDRKKSKLIKEPISTAGLRRSRRCSTRSQAPSTVSTSHDVDVEGPVVVNSDGSNGSKVIAGGQDETGFLDKLPRCAAACEMHKLYEDIEADIKDFTLERKCAEKLTRMVDKSYSQDAQSLIRQVFGLTLEEAQKTLIDVQFHRPLPLTIFLRSITAAAVMLWAVSPDPVYLVEPTDRSNLLTNLQEVIDKELGTGECNRLMFRAHQKTLQEQSADQIGNATVKLASRLYKVVNEFVEQPEQKVTSRCERPRFLAPPEHIVLHVADRMQGRTDVPPPPAIIDCSPLPGSTSLESDLTRIFESALRLRLKWSMAMDADIACDFPIFRQRIDETYMYNEEFVESRSESTGLPGRVMSGANSRVFVTLMFGVQMNAREKWSDGDYCGKNVVVTRPSIYPLD